MKTLLALALVSLSGASATADIQVTPKSVHRGAVVRVHGSVGGGCPAGDSVTLYSRAFSRRHEFAGVPAIYATVRSGGKFSKRTRIPAGRAPARYRVSGRCGGGNLGVGTHLRVLR